MIWLICSEDHCLTLIPLILVFCLLLDMAVGLCELEKKTQICPTLFPAHSGFFLKRKCPSFETVDLKLKYQVDYLCYCNCGRKHHVEAR